MTVAVVAPTVVKEDNGLEVHAVKIAKALSAVAGVRAHICTVDRNVEAKHAASRTDVSVMRFSRLRRLPNLARRVSQKMKPGRRRALIERIQSPGLSFGLGRHLFRHEDDVVIAVGIYPLTTAQCLVMRLVHCAPPVILAGLLHVDPSQRVGWQHRAALRLCDGYMANTESEAVIVRSVIGGRCPVAVIPPPMNGASGRVDRVTAREKLGFPVEGLLIGYVGRLTWAKGLDVLLDAFSEVSSTAKAVDLVLAGSTTADTDEIRAAALATPDQAGRIHVLADFSSSQAALIYSAVDIFVNPSRLESFGMVFADAWSFGLPVIGARIPAIADVITPGENGLLFDPGDPSALAHAITALMDSEERRHELGANGRAHAEQNYSSDVVAERLVALVERVIAR